MKLELVTPEKLEISTDASLVEAPGSEGDFGVLPAHAPFISTLRPGIVTVHADREVKIFITGGVAEVNPESCTILAEETRDLTGTSATDAQSALARAHEAAAAAVSEEDQRAANHALAIAEAVAQALAA